MDMCRLHPETWTCWSSRRPADCGHSACTRLESTQCGSGGPYVRRFPKVGHPHSAIWRPAPRTTSNMSPRSLFDHFSGICPHSVPRPVRRGAIWRGFVEHVFATPAALRGSIDSLSMSSLSGVGGLPTQPWGQVVSIATKLRSCRRVQHVIPGWECPGGYPSGRGLRGQSTHHGVPAAHGIAAAGAVAAAHGVAAAHFKRRNRCSRRSP